MPPKKQAAAGPSKKTENKKKEKVIEDKTFGLKNKKGAKTQKFVQMVTHQVKHGNVSAAKVESLKFEDKKKKAKAEEELEGINKIMKPVTEMPKVAKDVDPKSVVCAFFKQGICGKGAKCKFSHDLSIERKAEKRSMYVDSRDVGDSMETWDTEKLTEVVEKKHGEKEKIKPKTAIICKYFLEALENNKYGWFWECPNGDTTCIYRHALPPGYILNKDRKKLDEQKEDQITIEELVEKERAALGTNLTKITWESFTAWKKRKIGEKKAKSVANEKKKRTDFNTGQQTGLSGKDLFTFNPDLIQGDDEEATEDSGYRLEAQDDNEENQNEEEEQPVTEIDINSFIPCSSGDAEVVINEDLFGGEDMPDSSGDEESDEEEAGLTNGVEKQASVAQQLQNTHLS